MSPALDILLIPFLACVVLAGIHAYLGLHVLARGVIFVDLAFAQIAALGMAVALLAGHPLGGSGAYGYALAFSAGAAALLAGVAGRAREGAIPREAIIGIVYAVAAALTVIALDRLPQGGDQIKQLLVGDVLGVSAADVGRTAAVYAAIGLVHWIFRRPLLALSLHGRVANARAWDFVFYLTLGVVVTSSVRIAGVLLVFAYLIVPAVAGTMLRRTVRGRLVVGWSVGFAVSVVGLTASYRWDLPPGAAVVATFGLVLAALAAARGVQSTITATRRDGPRAMAGLGAVLAALLALAGLFLAAMPGADHPWLDAMEAVLPSLRTAFLTTGESATLVTTQAAIARDRAEIERLRAVEADAQWGARAIDADTSDRLRQFLAGRSEIVAGDRQVLATLRTHARHRQRFVIGIPLALAAGAAAMVLGRAARRHPASGAADGGR